MAFRDNFKAREFSVRIHILDIPSRDNKEVAFPINNAGRWKYICVRNDTLFRLNEWNIQSQ